MTIKTMIELAGFFDGSFTSDLGVSAAHSLNVATAKKRAAQFRAWGWVQLPSVRAKDDNGHWTTTSVWAIPA